jgi:uroporphyrinogen-III synthase
MRSASMLGARDRGPLHLFDVRPKIAVAQHRALGQAGISVVPVETYDTVRATLPDRELPVRLGNAPIDAVLLYSAVAAEVFAALLADPLAAPFFAQSTCFAISGRVAEVLPSQMRERARVAREPTEEAMLSMLTDGA